MDARNPLQLLADDKSVTTPILNESTKPCLQYYFVRKVQEWIIPVGKQGCQFYLWSPIDWIHTYALTKVQLRGRQMACNASGGEVAVTVE
jgi:hypothetical protein